MMKVGEERDNNRQQAVEQRDTADTAVEIYAFTHVLTYVLTNTPNI